MPVWEFIRNLVVAVAATISLVHYGPHIVDQYYLPTIDYVAGTFLAVAPHPPQATTFARAQPVMAIPRTTMTTKTIFVKAARSTPEGASITGVEYHQSDSSSHQNGFFHPFSSTFEWTSNIVYEFARTILLYLKHLSLNLSYQAKLLTGAMIGCQITRILSQKDIESLTELHETELAETEEKTSALAVTQNLEIASLKAQIESQKLQLAEKETLLDEARTGLGLVEEQNKSELAKLKSSLTDKDNVIAERDRNLTEANGLVKAAEDSVKNLEKRARRDRSDYDSTIQKKENEIGTNKRALEQAKEDKDHARLELKETRAQATNDKKRATDLEKQLAESVKKISELEAQGKNSKRIMVEKDKALRDGEIAKTTEKKRSDALQAQLTKANKLREAAEKKISTQETLAAEAAQKIQSKEAKISSLKEEHQTSEVYSQRLVDAARAANTGLIASLDKEKVKGQQAAAKAQQTERSLQAHITNLEEQLQSVTPPPSTIATWSSDISTLEPSPSPPPHPIVRIPGSRAPIHVSSASDESAKPSEQRSLPANTPTGPRYGRPGPEPVSSASDENAKPSEQKSLPANTPTGPRAGRPGLGLRPVSSASDESAKPSDQRSLPANTPTGPRSGRPGPRCIPPPNGTTRTRPEERGLPVDTPTGPKALGDRGGRKS